jgi:monoamine oxidase
MGCAWLHSGDTNPWTAIAEALGLEVDRTEPDWGQRFAEERQLTAAEAADRERFFELAFAAPAGLDGPDRPLLALLPADDPWLPAFAAVQGYLSGAGPGAVSAVDLSRYASSGLNWRVVAGYGTLVGRYGEGLPVTTGAPVRAVEWGGRDKVRVATARGDLRCRAVVVTVPVSLVARGAIRFDPPLPDAKLEAAAGLPMGNVAKLLLGVDGRPWDLGDDQHVVASPRRERTGAYHLRPFGRPLVEAYYGADLALEVERAGADAAAAFATDELAGLFGAGVRGRLRPLLATGWAGDPWSRGAYSYARPGCADGHTVLAEPLEGRLFFAGEACSRDAYSTAHGAYLTGLAAAEAVAVALS